MHSIYRNGILLAIFWGTFSHQNGYSRPLIEGGSERRGSASLGIVTGRDPSNLLTNPAALTGPPGLEAYTEASLMKLDANYTHPVQGKFSTSVVAPIVSSGLRYGATQRLSFGLFFLPTGAGTRATFSGLPADITAEDSTLVRVTASETSYTTAAGLSYQRGGASLGLSLGYFYKSQTVKLRNLDPDANIADASYSGKAIQPKIGGKWSSGSLVVAAAYSSGVYRRMSGKGILIGTPEGESSRVHPVEYIPGEIGLGLEIRSSKFQVRFEGSREDYSRGSLTQTTGMGDSDVRQSNLKDVTNLSASLSIQLGVKSSITTGISQLPGNMGTGIFPGEGGIDDLGIGGVKFGQFENLNRYVLGFGFLRKISKTSNLSVALSYCQGTLNVQERTPGQGRYRLKTLIGGAGVKFRLN
jgi:hypothetical protein